MKLYFLQDELNESLNHIVCCDYSDFEEIHSFYLNCYFDVEKFNEWFFNKYKKTESYIGIPDMVFTKI